MTRLQTLLFVLVLVLAILAPASQPAQAQDPVVHAVLFYSPSCPHCLDVINEVLPPLVDTYGSQLQIYGVNTAEEGNSELFHAAGDHYGIPQESRGVPTLIIDDQVLIGSGQIPAELPGIIEQGLEQGGIPWPDFPGFQEHRGAAQNEQSQEETEPATEHQLTAAEKFRSDPAGNTLALIVLFGMLGAGVYVISSWNDPLTGSDPNRLASLVPLLLLVGFGVSIYLSYVEVTQSEAVCGPVGNCNTVQQSKYAALFGLIPIGLLGAAGYLVMLANWLVYRLGPERWQPFLTVSLWVMSAFGLLFSIYLTFLEPFVIGASCLWCLTSALVMTALFLSTAEPARSVLRGGSAEEPAV
ncbi:MAG: vitamin K epoxide reductase family protein [Anaerolineales bacterium]|nr:vitamin K epoxide reductase family protein [Anaerolineales bacterium]